jgi:hypothetical protein
MKARVLGSLAMLQTFLHDHALIMIGGIEFVC